MINNMTTAVIDKVIQNEVVEIKAKNGNWDKEKRKSYSKNQALERLGETRINSHGSKMWIIDYTDSKNVTVQFEDDYIAHNITYQQFCSGNVKNPNDASVYGHGYIGEGKYKRSDDNIYSIWNSLLQRCYSDTIKEKYTTYKNATICKEWLNYQVFAEWYTENYYDAGEPLQIDKDILFHGNKLYSPDKCVLVPKGINVLFTKRDSKRGDTPIGVTFNKASGKYISRCQIGTGHKKCLGSFKDPIEAYEAYKAFKEQRIQDIAEEYKNKIPKKLYDAMMIYRVSIDD